DEIVHRRRPGQHGSGGYDGPAPDDRALVDSRVAAYEHIVFDDHGQRADRLDDAADLCAGAHVDAGANLRARADERMRVDERLFADPGADVDQHRRHADDARPEVRPITYSGAAGDDSHA